MVLIYTKSYPTAEHYNTSVNSIFAHFPRLYNKKELIRRMLKNKFKNFRNTGPLKDSPVVKAKKDKYCNKRFKPLNDATNSPRRNLNNQLS
ncbi:unnamed protein product [Brachionus calyciflorus]|uniref:Uncharacterized protein n=1 Tax=Brachionus calyciflorus TaxID=104777 RepID=A0A814KF88_9BILA|nr:unnamed protein product [Brachionus calyciflorus]